MNKPNTKILVADDELWYLEGVRDALESEGYEVITESRMTGDRCLEIVKNLDAQIDILILDIMMNPGPKLAKEVISSTHTGVAVCRKIREEIKPNNPGFPIICLTAVNDNLVLGEMRQMGCAVLKKAEVGVSDIIKAAKSSEQQIGKR
ncbi:response regulator [Candidatus Poribacteria bacterium]